MYFRVVQFELDSADLLIAGRTEESEMEEGTVSVVLHNTHLHHQACESKINVLIFVRINLTV